MRREPWLVPKAISFLERELVTPEWVVFEFGCGGSTLWYSDRVRNVHSVEHDGTWKKAVEEHLGRTDVIELVPRVYAHVVGRFPDKHFDFIAVDGRDRHECVKAAIPKVKDGGWIMLDNSERSKYDRARRMLHKVSVEQVGFWGGKGTHSPSGSKPAPNNWGTSFYRIGEDR